MGFGAEGHARETGDETTIEEQASKDTSIMATPKVATEVQSCGKARADQRIRESTERRRRTMGQEAENCTASEGQLSAYRKK